MLPIDRGVAAVSAIPDFQSAIATLLDEPERIRPVFQPIFDLQRGVVCGFEMLARFDHELQATPDKWFAAAARLGVGDQLEATLIGRGLDARGQLPDNCFLAVNVGPDALLSDPVGAVLAGRDLSALVVEVTESAPVEDYAALLRSLGVLRDQGASIAVDDAGAGYASLNHVIQIRPDFVKLDRALVMDVDRDPAKHALVETFGTLAGRLDAWLLAEGIEREGEREVLAAMGVPLAQGFGLARPHVELRGQLQIPAAPAARDALTGLLTTAVSVVPQGEHPPAGTDTAVVVDGFGRPLALLIDGRISRPAMTAQLTDRPADIAQRALTRSRGERFDPICCIDERGRLVGLIPFEHLVRHLARSERTHP